MARMNNRKPVDTEETLLQQDVHVEVQEPTGIDPMMKALLDQVKTLTNEVKQLKEWNKDWLLSSKNERYEWPRTYRYRLWWGVPVLSMKSKKKDITKPSMYFTPKWEQINNQIAELALADGSTIDVDVLEFWQFYEYSEPKVATEKMQPNGIKSYIFNDPTYWEIEVLSSVIN